MGLSPYQQGVLMLFGETFLYGIFTVLEVVVLYILMTDRKLSFSNKLLLSSSVLQYILTTIHEAATLYLVYVRNPAKGMVLLQPMVSMTLILLGDYVLIWRVWVIWSRRWWIIIVPLIVSTTSCIIGIVGEALAASEKTAPTLQSFVYVPVAALLVASTGLNTSLIVGRLVYQLWYTQRILRSVKISQSGDHHIIRATLLVFESGAIMITALIISLILERCNSSGANVAIHMATILYGIVPTSLIILVYLNIAVGNHTAIEEREEHLTTIRFDHRNVSTEDDEHTIDINCPAGTKRRLSARISQQSHSSHDYTTAGGKAVPL